MRGALRPSGRFLLETIDITTVMSHFQPVDVTERDGDFLLERRRYDPLRGGMDAEYVAVRGGEIRRYAVFIRNPTYTELRDRLLDAGFSQVDGSGEDGEPLRQGHRRMVVVARAG
jgi:hypothetical protein